MLTLWGGKWKATLKITMTTHVETETRATKCNWLP